MMNTWKLEKQVRAISLANRARRQVIAHKWQILGDATVNMATKPTVLGSALLVGFCFGLSKNRQPKAPSKGKKSGLIRTILPFAMSYLVHADRHDKQPPPDHNL